MYTLLCFASIGMAPYFNFSHLFPSVGSVTDRIEIDTYGSGFVGLEAGDGRVTITPDSVSIP